MEGASIRVGGRLPLGLFLLVYFLLSLVLHQFYLSGDVHWSGDSALKALQAEILGRSGFKQIAIPYRSAGWDADGKFFPFRPPFASKIENRYYCAYPIVFPALVALLQIVCGSWAGAVLVAFGSTLLLFFTYRLACSIAPDRALMATAVLAFASPVWVYSALLWGHTLAAACATLGLLGLLRARRSDGRAPWILAGIALGVTAWLRTEGYALIAAVLTATVLWGGPTWKRAMHNAALVLSGTLLALLPLAAVQWGIYGRPWGVHADGLVRNVALIAERGADAYLGPPQRKAYRLSFADWLLVRSTNYGSFSLKTAAPFVLFGVTVLVPRLRAAKTWILLNLGLILLVLLRVLWEVLATESRWVSGLFVVMPYSVLAFWYLPRLRRRGGANDSQVRLLMGIVAAFLLLSIVCNPGNKGGLQWGPRYLMPIFGVLLVLSFKAAQEVPAVASRLGRTLLVALVAVAAVLQLVGFSFIREDEKTYDRVITYLREHPASAIVGYDKVWLSQLCAPLYFEKDLLFADAPGSTRKYFGDSPALLQDYLDASKSYPNSNVLVLTHGAPLPELLPVEGGKSLEIAPRFWIWCPPEEPPG